VHGGSDIQLLRVAAQGVGEWFEDGGDARQEPPIKIDEVCSCLMLVGVGNYSKASMCL
jgi:hypothetical protein